MLVVIGEKDYRVPLSQGLMTFTALQRLGVPSRLLRFPDENHWVLKPVNSVQWYREVHRWMDQWTGAQPIMEQPAR
jgi:acylaminoacyl-peptidase